MVADGLWFQRNSQIFEQKHIPAAKMSPAVVANLRNFKAAQGWRAAFSPTLLAGALLKPPDGTRQVFFDGGISAEAAGVGVMISDQNVACIRAVSRRFPNVRDPLLAECMALEEALLQINALSLQNVRVAGDALQVIQMIKGDVESSKSCYEIVSRLRGLLENMACLGPLWISNSENREAHTLANYAKTSPMMYHAWSYAQRFLSFDSERIPETSN